MPQALPPAKVLTVAATYLLLESGSALLALLAVLWHWAEGRAGFFSAPFSFTFYVSAALYAFALVVGVRLLLWPRPPAFWLAVALLGVEACAILLNWWFGPPELRVVGWPVALGHALFVTLLLVELLRPNTRRYIVTPVA